MEDERATQIKGYGFCDCAQFGAECGDCIKIIKVGKRRFCGLESPGYSMHQAVRDQIGCNYCPNYTKRIDCVECMQCLKDNDGVPADEMVRRNKRACGYL